VYTIITGEKMREYRIIENKNGLSRVLEYIEASPYLTNNENNERAQELMEHWQAKLPESSISLKTRLLPGI
jgi:hypothetical protein